MNSLDSLFDEALRREALPTTEERRHAVAEVAVRGARRKRRVHATMQVAAVAAVVGLGAVVGSVVLGGDRVDPAEPTPAPSTPAPSPIATAGAEPGEDLDVRFPQAAPMTAEDWDAVTVEWDIELASFVGGGRDTFGSVFAAYFTAPGGERKLAFTSGDTGLVDPRLLSYDLSSHVALLFEGGVYSLNMETGAVTEADWATTGNFTDGYSLGRLPNGDSLFVIQTVNAADEYTSTVYRSGGGNVTPLRTGEFWADAVWGDRYVVQQDGVLLVVDATTGEEVAVQGLENCFFGVWRADGSFVAWCPSSQDRTGVRFSVDPETGATTQLTVDMAIDDLRGDESSKLEALTSVQAIDSARAWGDHSLGGLDNGPWGPPVIYRDGEQVADLGEGFINTPKSYSILFGIEVP